MTDPRPGGAPDGLRRLIARLDLDRLADGHLLARYLGERDEAAFAELVRRHGPLVYGVCRRRLGPGPDTDDAFQATFLVLYRKAGRLTDQTSLGNWLFGVAVRVARKGRAAAARRRAKEADAARPEAAPEPPAADDATERLIDAVARLPARYREAVVLCELGGRPRKDAAAALGIPEGTLASRLAYARKRLADRLTRVGTFAVPVPAALLTSTASATTGVGSVPATCLASEVVQAMTRSKLGTVVGLGALATAVCGLALAIAGRALHPNRPAPPPSAAERPPEPVPGWQTELQRAYGLRDGQVLKRVGPPYPESRSRFFDPGTPGHVPGGPHSADDSVLTYRFDGKRTIAWGLIGRPGKESPIGASLDTTLVWAIGFPPQAVEGDRGLLSEFVEGEFVLRTGAPPEKWVPEFERILRDDCKLPVRLTLREVTREAVVASGRLAVKPRTAGDSVAVRLDSGQVTWGRGGGGSGTAAEFLSSLGAFVNRHVVSEVAPPPVGELSWSFDSGRPPVATPADRDRALDADLRAVEAQTGLTFKVEARTVRVLEVTRDAVRGK